MNTEQLQESQKITIDVDKLPLIVPGESDFEEVGEDGQDYLTAPELEKIAKKLLVKHSQLFAHIEQCHVVFLWKKKGGMSGGKNVLGKTQSAAGLVRYFGNNVDFVIWAAADHLGKHDGMLNRQTAEALVFHELCHIGYDPEIGKIKLVTHGFSGFTEEIRNYGLWTEDIKDARDAMAQMGLF